MKARAPRSIVVADWGKAFGKRVAYRADVVGRHVERLEPSGGGWTVAGLVEAAAALPPPVVMLIDAAIGFPPGLFEALRPARRRVAHAMELLRAGDVGELGEARRHEEWSVRAPYIHVPKGAGALTAFADAAARHGVSLRRPIDVVLRAKSPLILSGIPGTVGSGSRDVMRAVGALDPARVAVWPFDGPLAALLASGRMVLGEMYPRAFYGHALDDERVGARRLLAIGKTQAAMRASALRRLAGLVWHRRAGVTLDRGLLGRARASEDDFDAYLSALGALRLALEGVSLEDRALGALVDPVAGGCVLGVLAAQLGERGPSPRRAFAWRARGAPKTVDLGESAG